MKQPQSQQLQHQGDELVSLFQQAITILTAMRTAQDVATETENNTLNSMARLGSANGVFVTPRDIPQDMADTLARESMEAHLQKVQSAQISSAAPQELAQLQQQADHLYKNRVIDITVIQPNCKPIEAVYIDPKSGKEHVSLIRSVRIKGFIDTIVLKNNVLVLRPNLLTQLITPKRQYYIIYPLNPEDISPAIRITIH